MLNRAAGRATLFDKPADYAAFEKVVRQAWERSAMRLLSYLVMPNHWHFVVWPRKDGELSTWAQWLTVTHVRRWHAHHHSAGTGPVYQGRFKKAPAMFKSAPAGAFNKRGRTYPVNDPDLLLADLDPFHQRPNNLSPFVPIGLL